MTLKTIRETRDVAPFRPFQLHLADGQVLPVVTTDHLLFLPNNREFLVVLPDGGFRFVDPSLVVSVGRGSSRGKARQLPK